MKFKELLTVTENKKNKQVNMSLRKKQLRKLGCSIEELLNMKLKKNLLKDDKPNSSKE